MGVVPLHLREMPLRAGLAVQVQVQVPLALVQMPVDKVMLLRVALKDRRLRAVEQHRLLRVLVRVPQRAQVARPQKMAGRKAVQRRADRPRAVDRTEHLLGAVRQILEQPMPYRRSRDYQPISSGRQSWHNVKRCTGSS